MCSPWLWLSQLCSTADLEIHFFVNDREKKNLKKIAEQWSIKWQIDRMAEGKHRDEAIYVALQLCESGVDGEDVNIFKKIWRVRKDCIKKCLLFSFFRNANIFPDSRRELSICFYLSL